MKKLLLVTILITSIALMLPAQERPEDAIEVEGGRSAEQYYNIGNWYSDRNQYFKAIAYYQAALVQKPEYCEALINMGLAYKAVERFDDSVRAYRRAVEAECSQPFIYFNLGNTLAEAGELKAAVTAYADYVERDQYDPEGYLNLGITQFRLERYADAAATFERLILLEPDNAYFIFQTARCYARLGNFEKTAAKVLKAYQVDPNIRYPLLDDDDFAEFRTSPQFEQIRPVIQEGNQE